MFREIFFLIFSFLNILFQTYHFEIDIFCENKEEKIRLFPAKYCFESLLVTLSQQKIALVDPLIRVVCPNFGHPAQLRHLQSIDFCTKFFFTTTVNGLLG